VLFSLSGIWFPLRENGGGFIYQEVASCAVKDHFML